MDSETEEYPQLNTEYLPVSTRDIDASNDQSLPLPRPARAWRIPFQKYGPFCLHLSLTILVATVCLCFIDGRSFNINSRRPQYVEADGSLSRVTSYLPLQSDVVTAVSVAGTATRVAGGWWAAGYIWRCIFIAMEGGGISLEGLSQVLSSRPPGPRHFARRRNMLIIYITLVATSAIDYFSAILTGSIIWEASDRLIPGSVPLTGIPRGVNGEQLVGLGSYVSLYEHPEVVAGGCASANLAWVELKPNFTSNNMEPATTFRRVIPEAQYLLTNSTLANVTIPFFAVDTFEWIQEPDQVLTDHQLPLFSDEGDASPYFSSYGIGGLLPDDVWGSFNAEHQDPHVVSETRLFSFRVERFTDNTRCSQNYTIDPGTQIRLHQVKSKVPSTKSTHTDCFAIANVTYRAGVATCDDCKFVSPTVVEAQLPLSLAPDYFTSVALAMAPLLGTNLLLTNYSIPWNRYQTRKDFAIEFTSRTYQAAWAAFSEWFGEESDSTSVEVALPTLRAKIVPWRVYLWVGLHLSVLVAGLLLVYVQSHYRHPWVEDTTMAIFWLDTSAVRSEGKGGDPWQPGSEIRRDAMLVLDEADQGSRSVKMKGS